jgi:hypothetical protein
MANFTALGGAIKRLNAGEDDTFKQLVQVGMFVTDIGRLTDGYMMKKNVYDETKRILCEEHPDTISAMGDLANILGDLGQRTRWQR